MSCLILAVANGGDDVGVGRTAAYVAAHALADFSVAERNFGGGHVGADMTWPARRMFLEHGRRRANLAGCAVATLKTVMTQKGRLHGAQIPGHAEALDGDDVVVLVHDRQRQTGIDASTVDKHRAGSALTVIAALLRAGKRQMFAQGIKHRGPRVE